jgi:hypothetical protein
MGSGRTGGNDLGAGVGAVALDPAAAAGGDARGEDECGYDE